MPFDDLELLAAQLKSLQGELARHLQGEPFDGFTGHLQTFQDALRNAAAEIAASDATEAESAAEPPRSEPATLEALLKGGETCRGLEHILGAVPPNAGPKTVLPDIRTPLDVVERMLTLAGVGKKDTVYDAGCGDGRIPVTAAHHFGARAVGIELLPERVRFARLHVQLRKVDSLVAIEEGDVLEADFSKATVVTLFISKGIMLRLRDKLRRQLPVGARVVSHAFDMGDWRPKKTLMLNDRLGHRHRLYLWVIDEGCKQVKNLSEDWEFWDDWSAASD